MTEYRTSRRNFLATVGAAGTASMLASSAEAAATLGTAGKGALAIDGGTPVRKEMLHYRDYGPQFYDDVEKQELMDVLESKYPFRWWGENSKVLQFENGTALGMSHRWNGGQSLTSAPNGQHVGSARLERSGRPEWSRDSIPSGSSVRPLGETHCVVP